MELCRILFSCRIVQSGIIKDAAGGQSGGRNVIIGYGDEKMIAFIRGKVYSYDSESMILDNNGIGYKVYFNMRSPLAPGEEVTVFTYQQFLEDGQNLYGFLKKEELELFERLISVKGLGPRTAMKILAADSHTRIIAAIENADTAYLKKLPGIGKASASQIVLDLKGKLVSVHDAETAVNPELADAIEALKTLGYRPAELNGVISQLKQSNCTTSNEYLRLGLQLMRKGK